MFPTTLQSLLNLVLLLLLIMTSGVFYRRSYRNPFIPPGTEWLLHRTRGEGPGQAITLTDLAAPVAIVSSVTFVDTDPGTGQVGGTVAWAAPANPAGASQFTEYRVYLTETWAESLGENEEEQGCY